MRDTLWNFNLRILRYLIANIVCLLLLWGLWLGCRAFLCDQFVVPSASMLPTLQPGDRILVDKTLLGARIYSDFHFAPRGGELHSWRTRGRRNVRRGDILVFNFPKHEGRISFVINHVYAKRCIALPGDTLSIEDCRFRVSGHDAPLGHLPAQEALRRMPDSLCAPFLRAYPFDEHIPWTIKQMGPFYVPRRGDYIALTPHEATLYRLLIEWETGRKLSIDWERGEVRAEGRLLRGHTFCHDYYFLCGDNVLDSSDSRYWGLVPEEYLVGIVTRISYSLDPATGQRRRERTWKKLTL